ncbi:hypothetical protein M404DRAFT_1005522 [Pisolithus tinctorius Marx 270]|uniref:Uncharacterized protein n=1 Tax=Pisolithus tinctorius Marx 270 TaxID=870435 RepID=A0A0C3JKQ6_PISTI|nr:hypothetical protein M404DRAFT_1005522 [Pisolithus tinctorius Marx 270]
MFGCRGSWQVTPVAQRPFKLLPEEPPQTAMHRIRDDFVALTAVLYLVCVVDRKIVPRAWTAFQTFSRNDILPVDVYLLRRESLKRTRTSFSALSSCSLWIRW